MAICQEPSAGPRNRFGNGPQKAHQLTGHSHHPLVCMFTSGHEASVAFTKPDLSFPGDVLEAFRWFFEPHLQVSTDLSRIARRPGAFDQHPTGMGVTSFRDGALPAPLGPRVGRGTQAQELHEFLGDIDAREVAECGHHGDRHG
jgi:hypothetical protein